MNSQVLLETSSVLNELVMYSNQNVEVEFKKYNDGNVVCEFWHYSSHYQYGCQSLKFRNIDSINKMKQKLEVAKKVIAGEGLIDEQLI